MQLRNELGRGRRPGFTLIELIVVISILLLLAAIAVLFVPRAQEQDRAASGARQLMAWLNMVRSQAMRDQSPRGLRLQPLNDPPATPGAPGASTVALAPIIPSGAPTNVLVAAIKGVTTRGWAWKIQSGIRVLVTDPNGQNAEIVAVLAVAGNTFKALFTKAHPANSTVQPLLYSQELQFIEQPGDFVLQPGVSHLPGSPTTGNPRMPYTPATPRLPIRRIQVVKTGLTTNTAILEVPEPRDPTRPLGPTLYPAPFADFSGGFPVPFSPTPPPPIPPEWPVQVGDSLEIQGCGLVNRIVNINTTPLPNLTGGRPYAPGTVLTLANNYPQTIALTQTYRVIRQPRVSGQEPLQLPQDVVIDIGLKGGGHDLSPPTGSPPPPFDFLFAPSGAVIGGGAAYDKIIFWVRDATQANPWDNEPVLVCVYTRSGTVAAHPVDGTAVGAGNPTVFYSFTTDGKASGQQ